MACSYVSNLSEEPKGASDLRCPADWQVLSVTQGLPLVLTALVDDPRLDTAGDYIDGDLDESSSNPYGELVRLVFRDSFTCGDVRIVGGVRTGARTFQFNFNSADTTEAGLFVGEIIIYDKTQGGTLTVPTDPDVPDPSAPDEDEDAYRPVYIHRVYVEVQDSSFAPNDRSPPTIAEVRLWLSDNCPAGNYLIDDFEFTDKDIAQAMKSVVDYWNEVPPPVTRYSVSTFPFRYHHLLAITSVLMRKVGRVKLRNWLPVSTAGVSVQDQSIWAEYHKIGDQYWDEYRQFVITKKVEINISGGYRYTPGKFSM